MGKSWEERAAIWDAKYNFPRPINEQFLSPYKAFLRYARDTGRVLGYFAATVFSLILVFYIWLKISEVVPSYSPGLYIPCLLAVFLSIFFFSIDRASVMWAYSGLFQRDSKGSAKWATVKHLKDKNLFSRVNDTVVPKKIPIVPFGTDGMITVPTHFFAQHGIVIGPSGCGKTSTTFMNLARNFSKAGSLIALDISKDKAGEFYAYTASYFDDSYRFDLMNSEFTDWFYLFEGCQGDSVQAGKVAAYIIGRDGNKESGGGDIWDTAAELMLKCMILHICELSDDFPYPSPSEIYDFLAANPTDAVGDDGKPFNKLKDAMENSPNKDVRVEWASVFSAVGDSSPKTYGSIVFTLTTKMAIFRDPKVQVALRAPTPEETKAGRRKIDIASMRKMSTKNSLHKDGIKRGKSVYVIISEGEASRLKTVLATFFGVAKDILKRSGDKPSDAYVLFALDEAGNVPLVGLSEDFGVGRGRKMIFFLGFQGISQLSKQYGAETARTIFENTGTYIIFPGAKDNTAEWVEKMLGKTTMLSRSASDSVNDNFDSEKLSEEQRPLMFADEIRKMRWFTTCIVLHNDVDPILARVNEDAKSLDPRRCIPRQVIFAKKSDAKISMPLVIEPLPPIKKTTADAGNGQVVETYNNLLPMEDDDDSDLSTMVEDSNKFSETEAVSDDVIGNISDNSASHSESVKEEVEKKEFVNILDGDDDFAEIDGDFN